MDLGCFASRTGHTGRITYIGPGAASNSESAPGASVTWSDDDKKPNYIYLVLLL